MLVFDSRKIGNKLLAFRKRAGLTQAEVAERADISDRTYADIERGTANTRTETLLRICDVLHITPDEILTENESSVSLHEEEILAKLGQCSSQEKETALRLLSVYLQSLS